MAAEVGHMDGRLVFGGDEGGEMWVQLVRIGNVVASCCFLDGTCREEVREEVDGVYPLRLSVTSQ